MLNTSEPKHLIIKDMNSKDVSNELKSMKGIQSHSIIIHINMQLALLSKRIYHSRQKKKKREYVVIHARLMRSSNSQ